MSFSEASDKDDSCPTLSLSTDKTNIFVADQTPTPTRLIRNCEEIGLFDDLLKHDNPFDETFRRAIEQSYEDTNPNRSLDRLHTSAEDLHTPQVYPQLDNVSDPSYRTHISDHIESLPNTSCVTLDVPCLTVTEDNLISERSVINSDILINGNSNNYLQTPKLVHIVQPQVVTWQVPSQNSTKESKSLEIHDGRQSKQPKAILPKPSSSSNVSYSEKSKPSTNLLIPPTNTTHHEPSSASLTPTSQLPIKERLKAIINSSQNNRFFEEPKTIPKKNLSNRMKFCSPDDSLERKRAACVRYRTRIRSEQKELKRENDELKAKNKKLIDRVKFLEKELEKCKNSIQILPPNALQSETCQLRIPPSSINLVINVPSLVLPVNSDQNIYHAT